VTALFGHRTLRHKALVGGLLVILLIESCTTNGRAPTDRGQEGPKTLRWRACASRFECATLEVPVDHERPNGREISLGLVRQTARDSSRRIGTLLLNPGGPGGSAVTFVEDVAPQLDDAVQDRFDIVGFDPRGVGRSNAIDCAGEREMYLADPTIDDDDDRDALLATSRAFVADCARKYEELLPHLGTRDVARDMERLRVALAEDELTFVGLSYGTVLGQVYADMFPKRVRAMVLDGVVDLAVSGIESARLQALGFERVLKAFADDCRAKPLCPITQDPIGAVERVIEAAERGPLPAPARSESAEPGLVTLGLFEAMYSPSLWNSFSTAVAAAVDGDASSLARLGEAYFDRASFEVYFAVSCLDSEWPGVEELLATAETAARVAPHFGQSLVADYIRCSLWPSPPRPLASPVADQAPAMLLVSTTNDPATPYAGGVAVADRLPGSVLLTKVGNGHTAVVSGDPCIDRAVTSYLVDLELPTKGTRC